jgi:hypothetical protein
MTITNEKSCENCGRFSCHGPTEITGIAVGPYACRSPTVKIEHVSPTRAKDLVRYLGSGAWVMCGSLHPDEIEEAQRYVRLCKRTLFAIIDGRVKVVKTRRWRNR